MGVPGIFQRGRYVSGQCGRWQVARMGGGGTKLEAKPQRRRGRGEKHIHVLGYVISVTEMINKAVTVLTKDLFYLCDLCASAVSLLWF